MGIFATTWAYTRLKELATLRRDRLDPVGNVLFAGCLSVFLLGMTLGAISGFTAINDSMMTLGLLMIVGFIYAETEVSSPMMDLRLFRIRAFSAGMLSNLLASIARGAVVLLLVFYFQGALLLDALTAGILLIPFSVAFVSIGPLSGYLSDRYGARGFSTGGLVISAAALFWFALLPTNVPYNMIAAPMILVGIGSGMFAAPNIASVMNASPAARRGIAAGISSTMITTGFLLSLDAAFVVLATSMPLSILQDIFAGLPVAANELNVGLFMDAMHETFLIMALFSLVAAVPSLMRGPKRAHQ